VKKLYIDLLLLIAGKNFLLAETTEVHSYTSFRHLEERKVKSLAKNVA
jgi:hypothetical protein